MKPVANAWPQTVIMKRVASLSPAPKDRQAHTQRLYLIQEGIGLEFGVEVFRIADKCDVLEPVPQIGIPMGEHAVHDRRIITLHSGKGETIQPSQGSLRGFIVVRNKMHLATIIALVVPLERNHKQVGIPDELAGIGFVDHENAFLGIIPPDLNIHTLILQHEVEHPLYFMLNGTCAPEHAHIPCQLGGIGVQFRVWININNARTFQDLS